MRKIEAALERMAMGDFGICAACGRVIDLKRLEAMPLGEQLYRVPGAI
jgi:RNA polymerase-binding transcription factor DksA